ncbi:EamA family transporter [Rhizobiales bacterium RZME27]|uniref:EamA family transporter n=1 Tax=Endobacterium cereale TaxID=2663029 RepID=A0A6A8A1T5_9HYPH|nr:DMT family transporter [Endobacterium cereale]MEB2845050.1 DMT family transporter [Endobacterium cereale]MQY44962.1 EamA family transporter [Endobacterium cereale]
MNIIRSQSPVALGMGLMLVGMLMFALNDTMGKWLVSSYSLSQILFIRSTAAFVILAPAFWRHRGQLLTSPKPGLQSARAILSTAEVASFYFVVGFMPLADAMTYWLAAPIYVAALSPILLKEKVGWRRWSAIAVGFLGVVIALQPGAASFGLPALLALAGSAAFAFMMISGRQLRDTPDIVLVFWQVVSAGVAGLVFLPWQWSSIQSGFDLGMLCLLGVVASAAHLLVNRALKLADAATVVPLQYTLLLWAMLFGWIFFDDIPKPATLVGAALIVAAGLYIFFRENRLRKKRPPEVLEPAP